MSILAAADAITVTDWIDETLLHLGGDSRAEYDQLNASIAASADTLVLKRNPTGVGAVAGSLLSIGDELCLVWSVSGASITLQRGHLGTTAASHAADALIQVNPRFPRALVKKALRDEIRSWGRRVFAIGTASVSVSNTSTSTSGAIAQAVDLNIGTSWFFGLELRRSPASGGTAWPKVNHWYIDRDADTGDFTNGNALVIQEQIPSGTARLVYAKPFTLSTFDDATEAVGDIGLAESMVDIPALGAAWRLMSTREVARTDARPRGTSGRGDDVPPGHLGASAAQLKQARDARLAEEFLTLKAKYPVRK